MDYNDSDIRRIFEINLNIFYHRLQKSFHTCLNYSCDNDLNLALFHDAENTNNNTEQNEIILSIHQTLVKQVCAIFFSFC